MAVSGADAATISLRRISLPVITDRRTRTDHPTLRTIDEARWSVAAHAPDPYT
jgi:hypothetical protein